MAKKRMSRREFLHYGTLTAMGAIAAACAGAPATPAAPAAAPATTSAGAAATTAPFVATAAPVAAAAATTAPKIGSSLIGKLEGPEVVLDPARYPTTFREAPQLAELVKAGKLPPVQERIGEDPLVIAPLHEVGAYGGTWRRGFTGPGDKYNGYRAAGCDALVFWDYSGTKLVPNTAKSWEVSEDGKVTTITLRKGMKWSDGEPFTADDIMFWFEDMFLNLDIMPTPNVNMQVQGKVGKVEKIDDLSVRFVFPEANYIFPNVIASQTALQGHAICGKIGMGGYAPAHYLKQFHPKYVSQAELDQKIKDAKQDNWVKLFLLKNDWALNPDLPVLTPWKTATPINTPQWTLERNPYSIWVDTDGNQLPYIDTIQMALAENLEVLNLRAVAGELDHQARHIDLQKLPVFVENQQKGDYKVHLDPGSWGADMYIGINQTYDKDPVIKQLFANRDFRRALSLGIDRDQINETFWLGTGTPGSHLPAENTMYNPGAEYRTKWAHLDVKAANDLLDKVGLTKKDAAGYRLRPDGGRLTLEIVAMSGQFLPFGQISEMIKQQWQKIGVDLNVQELERSLWETRNAANETQLVADGNDGSEDIFLNTFSSFPTEVSGWQHEGPLFGQWFVTSGKEGVEPPPAMREVMAKWQKGFTVHDAERIQLGKEIWATIAEEVWDIGVVGLACAYAGVRLAKNKLGNVPEREYNSPHTDTEANSRPATFYWKA